MEKISIINIFISYSNILILDSVNNLWIMGSNIHKKSGFGSQNKHIYSPIKINIKLQPNENIEKFYSNDHITVIYTTNCNLYVSNFLIQDEIDIISYDEIDEDSSVSDEYNPQYLFENNVDIISRLYDILNDNNHQLINNNDYFKSLVLNKHNGSYPKDGFSLISKNVDKIMIIYNTIIFSIKDNLYLFDLSINIENAIINKKMGLSMILYHDYDCPYYKICFPFNIHGAIFHNKFIYFYVNNYHHVLLVSEYQCNMNILWIYFTADFPIDHTNIFANSSDSTIYIIKFNKIFIYNHATHTIEQISSTNYIKIFVLNSNDDIDTIICTLQKDGLWMFNTNDHYKICNYDSLLYYFIDINVYQNSNLILINVNNESLYTTKGVNFYFNIYNVIYYKLLDNGIIYYYDDTIYYCTTDILLEEKYGTIEIDKIEVGVDTYYIYVFNNIPKNIQEISLSNSLIMVKTSNKYYYHAFISETNHDFTVNKFTEIIINNDTKLVMKHQIIRYKKIFSSTIDLNIGINSNKYYKFLNIIELLGNDVDFNIIYVNQNKTVSHGDGPKREFMNIAIKQFSELYLIDNNYNMDTIIKLSKEELINIGYMLHTVICHSKNSLPVRLPLSLLHEIKKKDFTIEELEYFLHIHDPTTYNTIIVYRDNPTALAELDSYDTYIDLLNGLCNIMDIYHNISSNIAIGFLEYAEIKNLDIMNYPTLDYYLSGNYVIDRNILLKNLKIKNKYLDIMTQIIISLPEVQLVTLLMNWTGTSIVKSLYEYTIIVNDNIDNLDINFATCTMTIYLSKRIIMDDNMKDMLLSLLTTPIGTMIN